MLDRRQIRLNKDSNTESGCNMGKFSTKIEMIVYRFIMSLVFGFFLGSYIISKSDNSSVLQSIERVFCGGGPRPGREPSQSNVWLDKRTPRLDIEKGVLYVGMMSMSQYLDTRVVAVTDTWARNQNIRLEVFANTELNGTSAPKFGQISTLDNGAKIVQLPGVADVSYPPQRKSFSMLKFMYDNHLNNFDWFLRVDDDAYIKADQLVKFLSRADPNKPILIGRAGYGKHAEDYLEPGENYCMGGTGIIFSRELLRRIGPELSNCLNNMFTEHEDVELGRCVRKVAGVSCTEAWETTNLFYQNYGGKGSYDANINEIAERKRAVSMTFHANKEARYQYRLHQTLLSDKITDMISKITKMETEIKKMESLLKMKSFDDRAWNAHAGYVWDTISPKSVYSTSNLVRGIPSSVKESAVRNIYYTIPDLRETYPLLQSHIREISVTHTMYYVNPLTSVDMIAKLKVRSTVDKKSVYIHLRNVYFRRTFADFLAHFTEENDINLGELKEKRRSKDSEKHLDGLGLYTDSETRVNFIMALSGRPDNLIRFLGNFKTAFLSKGENVSLTIVYFPEIQTPSDKNEQIIDADANPKFINQSTDSDSHFVSKLLDHVRLEYPGSHVNYLKISNGMSFSRGYGLQKGTDLFKNDDLLFFCDVDLVFSTEMLYRIRRSTIKGVQVYYPTFFSQYDPEIVYNYQEAPQTQFYFEEIAGFWRTFSYGMVALYKSDFLATGGFDLSIQGWGLEDLRFCDAVTKKAGLNVFKVNEPAMVHIYHDKDCPYTLAKSQYESCQNSRAQHFGPRTLLYYIWQQGSEADDDDDTDPNVKVDSQIQT